MDYTGKKVFHKIYGPGSILRQDDKGYIYVQFDKCPDSKKFSAPMCFQNFLKLEDKSLEEAAQEEGRKKELEREEERQKRARQANQAKGMENPPSRRGRKSTPSSTWPGCAFSSVSDFFKEQEGILRGEISYLRKMGGKRIRLMDGCLIEEQTGNYIYSFEADSEVNIPDNTMVTLYPPLGTGEGEPTGGWDASAADDREKGIPAILIGCEDFTVLLSSSQNLGEKVPAIDLSQQTWRLLQFLTDRFEFIQENPSPIVKALIFEGEDKIQPGREIQRGQERACQMSLAQPITFVWGPPGTGKTQTLSKLAWDHLNKGERVLMLSYSNVSVDGAILRVFQRDPDPKPGRLVRYGYSKDQNLLSHEYLTSYKLTLRNHPELCKEREQILAERKKLPRTSPSYVKVRRRLTQIREQLSLEEHRAVENASFVATTVTKAFSDKTIYEDTYDTVIFDEASMAYIPQIIFSASLAIKHFVCMGDFLQLPPIVQSDSASSLNQDIFSYCKIEKAVEQGAAHEWLCLLDTQYRMHPEIASFASCYMYRGLLKSGPELALKRAEITGSVPFKGNALFLADLSGMLSVCTKTRDQSRINCLSALLTFGLALNAAKENEVGIITPYNAQSRLLHAMSQDVAELYPGGRRITCATVHQFQGSEKDVILYDAVDCYRMPYPGSLLTTTANHLANRLYNVALTRARGKMISVVNVDYMKAKSLSRSLMFRRMIDVLTERGKAERGEQLLSSATGRILESFSPEEAREEFFADLEQARKEIYMDLPGGTGGSLAWLQGLAKRLREAKRRGVKVVLRTNEISLLPKELREFGVVNKFVANPVTLLDKALTWYGCPFSNEDFLAEGRRIPTLYRPLLRFEGKHFAHALYGFLEMHRTIDMQKKPVPLLEGVGYTSLASYVAGKLICPECKSSLRLKKSKNGKFFLGCEGYPLCSHTEFIKPEVVNTYLFSQGRQGKRCPKDNTSLEARVGRYGLYVCCNNELERHTYKLDEI